MGSVAEMLLKLLLLVFSLILSAKAVNRGSIQVEGYGEVWVISPDWANVQVDGNAYWQIPLNNKVFSYSVDVSNVGCHCNAAAYFIDMPGNNAGSGGGDWYCDAN